MSVKFPIRSHLIGLAVIVSQLEMGLMWFLRIIGFGCEITKSSDSDIDKSSHEEFSVNKNVGLPAVLHGFQLSKH